MILRGAAGVGKTTLMSEAAAGHRGERDEGFAFAPSTDASRVVLRDDGFKDAETVATLLVKTSCNSNALASSFGSTKRDSWIPEPRPRCLTWPNGLTPACCFRAIAINMVRWRVATCYGCLRPRRGSAGGGQPDSAAGASRISGGDPGLERTAVSEKAICGSTTWAGSKSFPSASVTVKSPPTTSRRSMTTKPRWSCLPTHLEGIASPRNPPRACAKPTSWP